jgi:selenocysteine lyase/cysteine desulfurase
MDNAPYLCIPTAIQYRQERYGGEDAIIEYMHKLARRAGEIVSKALGTEVLENEESTLQNCPFSNVRLPLDPPAIARLAQRDGEVEAVGNQVRDWIAISLIKQYGTFVSLMFYGGAWWTRLSAQVYLDEADFVKAGEILKDVCKRVEKGEFLENLGKSKL